MKRSFNKLAIYGSLLVVGGGAGFWVSSSQKKPVTIIEQPPVYSEAISKIEVPTLDNNKSNQERNFIAQAVQRVGPAVVRIDASRELTSSLPNKLTQPFLRKFFGDDNPESVNPSPRGIERGTGSGFILSQDGRVITNAHVVEGSNTVTVTLKDGQTYEGRVLGVDPVTDVAVLKIEADDLPFVSMGRADNLTPGEWAIAIGNPLGLDNTVTVGIISAIGRSSSQVGVPDKRVRFIQTDAAINPGNSGGPLLNGQGEVIGMNTAIRADAQGLGFAIPIETAQKIADQLFAKGKADHPYLGVHMVNLSPQTKADINRQKSLDLLITEDEGVLIVKVVPNSPADKAGLKEGDTIVTVRKKPIQSSTQVQEQVDKSEIGQALPLEVIRQGKKKAVVVKPGVFPDSDE